eukprot:Hpha_TRINITY_DN14877_c0_g1::TRINITY_DN14877_c0_g1_i1::g.169149::m.169149
MTKNGGKYRVVRLVLLSVLPVAVRGEEEFQRHTDKDQKVLVNIAPSVTKMIDQAAKGDFLDSLERSLGRAIVRMSPVPWDPNQGRGPTGNCSLFTSIENEMQDVSSISCRRDGGAGPTYCDPIPLRRFTGTLWGAVRKTQMDYCLGRCSELATCVAASFVLDEVPQIPGACVMYRSYLTKVVETRSLLCTPTQVQGHLGCNFTGGLRVGMGTVLEQGVTVSAQACCESCASGRSCVIANFFPFPPPGPPHGWDRRGPCDPKHCSTSVDTTHWFCGSLNGSGCLNIKSHDYSRQCPSDGYLACPGDDAGYGPPMKRGEMCGCSTYVGTSDPNDDVLCVAHPKNLPPNYPSGGKCLLPMSNGECPSGYKLCSRATPRLVLKETPTQWSKLRRAVEKAANVTSSNIQVFSLCPASACEPSCPHSSYLRWKAGCVNTTRHTSELPKGEVVFDFDIADENSDNRTRQVALAVLIAAAQVAANNTNQTVVNTTQGALELRKLGVKFVLLDTPPATHTEAAAPPPPPSSNDPLGFMGGTVGYVVIGCCCLALVIAGVVARKVRWKDNVDFDASRGPRRRGMEGCQKTHGESRRKEVNIDDSDSHSRSTSSSDSEPEEDL